MITHIGFEQEVFVVKTYHAGHALVNHEYVNLYDTTYPRDTNPYLLELRGLHAPTPLRAKYELLYVLEQQQTLLRKDGMDLDLSTWAIVLNKLERQVLRRQEQKEPMKQYRIGGRIKLPRPGIVTAGLHVHFSNDMEVTRYTEQGKSYREVHHYPIDIPRIVYLLDKAFEKEICDTERQSGLYEIKKYGFEYRSLPTTVDLDKVVRVLEDIQKEVK